MLAYFNIACLNVSPFAALSCSKLQFLSLLVECKLFLSNPFESKGCSCLFTEFVL